MTTLEDQFKNDDNFNNWEKNQRRGRMIAGLFVIGAAVLFFMRQAGTAIPHWVFTWPSLLIVVGIVSGIKHQFKNIKWLALIAIGSVFLAGDVFPALNIEKYELPIILLIIGLVLSGVILKFIRQEINKAVFGSSSKTTTTTASVL